ncbi:hypothetical protein ACQKGL_29235 [Ensifer adhaerens]|uniref:hypothetical protein n=1 Tax=Ensifer adhaerens TaxID=106592 RepID=UPI003CFDEC04
MSKAPRRRQLPELLASSDNNVVAIHTHGSEACAKAEDGIVFCGRNRLRAEYSDTTDGVLACGRSGICPRGPKPTPIDELAGTLMMAACNGLRLADSINHPDFNFALSFVDGPGLAYISSVTSTAGAGPATCAFMASLADGYTIGEAVLSANAVPLLAKVEDPAFFTIGNIFYRPMAHRDPHAPIFVDTLPAEIDASDHHSAILYCTDPDSIVQLRRSNLTVVVEGPDRSSLPIAVVRQTQIDGGFDALEVRIYSFPEELKKVRVSLIAIDSLMAETRSALEACESWISDWRRLGLHARSPDSFSELLNSKTEISHSVSEKISQLRWSGNYQLAIARQINATNRFLDLIASEAVVHLVDELAGPFWLTNQLAAEYCLEGSDRARCPQCAGNSRVRRLVHSLLPKKRHVIVCSRCGIVFDGPADEGVPSIRLGLIEPARSGQQLAVKVLLTPGTADTCTLSLGLTMPGQKSHRFDHPYWELDGKCSDEIEVTARCNLDRDLAPHRYYVKALLGSREGLSFASLPFFVQAGGLA